MKLLSPVSIGLPQLWLEDSKCSLVKVSSSVASEENQIRVKTTSPGLTLRHSPVCTQNWVDILQIDLSLYSPSEEPLWSGRCQAPWECSPRPWWWWRPPPPVQYTVQYSTVQCPLHLLLLPGEQPQHVRVTGEPVLPPDLGQHVHLCRYSDSYYLCRYSDS